MSITLCKKKRKMSANVFTPPQCNFTRRSDLYFFFTLNLHSWVSEWKNAFCITWSSALTALKLAVKWWIIFHAIHVVHWKNFSWKLRLFAKTRSHIFRLWREFTNRSGEKCSGSNRALVVGDKITAVFEDFTNLAFKRFQNLQNHKTFWQILKNENKS